MSRIGIPVKGRNAGVALEQELDIGAEFIVELLNGKGKKAAKTGQEIQIVEDYVDQIGFLEMRDTGRPYNRPVFTEFDLGNETIVGGENNFGELEKVYKGIDRLVEEKLDQKSIREEQGLVEYAQEVAQGEEYDLEEVYGDDEGRPVTWGLMNDTFDQEITTVVYPEEFANLSEEIIERSQIKGVDTYSFQDYASKDGLDLEDEEELIYEAPSEVAGIYMWVTGNTAKQKGLETLEVDGFKSKLGKFKAKS